MKGMTKIKTLSNLESVGELMGSLSGMRDGLDEEYYMAGLIKEAHGMAANAFDIAAASVASTGQLQHVYEFGVAGVTPGSAKIGDATSPAARLWVHTLIGKGGTQDIGYSFRPATQPNPKPTTASTGVPQKYLSKLSPTRYLFYNKAFVMETGMKVTIPSHREHGLIFVPTPGNNAPRNYMMWNTHALGPLHTWPGKKTAGTFSALWMRWWAGAGAEIIDGEIRRQITIDIEKAEADALANAKKRSMMKPAVATNVPAVSKKARSRARAAFGRLTRSWSKDITI